MRIELVKSGTHPTVPIRTLTGAFEYFSCGDSVTVVEEDGALSSYEVMRVEHVFAPGARDPAQHRWMILHVHDRSRGS
jgi:hypothetical protein